MSTVTVLCPNARRQQVKINANTKILEIIEEVCKKQGYDPTEYDLIHQRKALDVALTFRLSGLPNNAQLDLRKCENGPRKFDDVTISLQIEDGTRLPPLKFKPDQSTLFDLIQANLGGSGLIESASINEEAIQLNNIHPVINYLNEQVVGLFQLRNTTLKDLGLTNGRVIVRFSMKSFDRETIEKLDAEFRLKLEKKQKLDEIFIKKKQLEEQQQQSSVEAVAASEIAEAKESKRKTDEPDLAADNSATTRKTAERQQQTAPTINYQSNRTTTAAAASSNMDFEVVDYKGDLAVAAAVTNEYANFKFPEETKGKNLNFNNELADIERISREPCDRQAIMYDNVQKSAAVETATSSSSDQNAEQLPEDFFEVNVNDLQYMLSDLKQKQAEETPLMTKRLRELEQDKRAMKYSQVVIRVSFKDRYVLQGFFRPKENVESLYEFVRNAFSTNENGNDDLDFYLYTTPPKLIISDMNKTLFESQLCPASVVYFKNKSDRMPVFKPDLLGVNFKTVHEANEMVNANVHKTMRQIEHDGIDYLVKEQKVLSNLIRSSGLGQQQQQQQLQQQSTNRSSSDSSSTRAAASAAGNSSDVNRKLERFLKGGSSKK